jgi:hypothetical protein
MTSATTTRHLARIGAAAGVLGAPLLLVSTLLHPLGTDPNDATAAFAEYAASSGWVWIHLGQFLGLVLIGLALVAFAGTLEDGPAAAWARFGSAGATAGIALAAALQAVDGVALKVMADRLAAASAEARGPLFEAVFAVRQIEIGLGALLSLVTGLTLSAYGVALVASRKYPSWAGWSGLLDGLGMMAAGAAQATTGFSELAMTISMLASSGLLVWVVVIAVVMWRPQKPLQIVGLDRSR